MKRATLKTIAAIDIVIVIALNVLGCAGAFYAHGFWIGLDMISEWYSPFNISTYLLNAILLGPAILCYWLMNRPNQNPRSVG